ncbi:phosphodiester glycosidase family protein [Gottfriedia acidiceleris]|uniref:phosphodiester glycosidase family protein n=1 Tax=Gottfriedia acidiceleris TaxID=371036 RepID=UPI000B447315|nr:phosphodiester glycosidase family protein [Gottfriedia acidiceleris]
MATNYKYSKELMIMGRPTLHVIKTKISNICTETICRPLADTSYFGINGGFFSSSNYKDTPTSSRSICVDRTENNVNLVVKGKKIAKNYHYNGTSSNSISRKTAVIYTSGGKKKMTYMYAKQSKDIITKYPTYSQIIGGNDYSLDAWGAKAYHAPLSRTVLAWDNSNAYLIVTDIPQTIPSLKNYIKHLGLSTTNSIVLDGSGSTSMKCKEFTKNGDKRYIFNMIRIINMN